MPYPCAGASGSGRAPGDCDARTWIDQSAPAEPRRAEHPGCQWRVTRVAGLEGTPSSIARDFGVAWSMLWSAVERIGGARVDDAARVGPRPWRASTRRLCRRPIADGGAASSPTAR